MNFDKVAPFYSFLEKIAFGNKLQVARIAFLERLTRSQNILLIGEGRGRVLAEILRNNSQATITVVESSSSMVYMIKKTVQPDELKRVTFVNSSFQKFFCRKKFDAVCTCFFWDCFSEKELRSGLSQMHKLTQSKGLWINVDFAFLPSSSVFSNLPHKFTLHILYGFFQISCGLTVNNLTPIGPIASQVGFELAESLKFNAPSLSSEIYLRT
ncbi:MAG: class I SAM-dependent methyltransferase [Opitutae bacterium]